MKKLTMQSIKKILNHMLMFFIFLFGMAASSFAADFSTMKALADRGDAKAQEVIGSMYDKGDGVVQNKAKAKIWYEKSAKQGYAVAQYNLANMYYYGQGVSKNYYKAAEWYEKTAEQGDITAIDNKKEKVYLTSEKLLMEAMDDYLIKDYISSAQYNLANMYYYGQGVSKNYYKAAELLEKAAADDLHQEAQYALGTLYYNGEGKPKNYFKAAEWFEKAAEWSHAEAQFNLGVMYYYGYGFRENEAVAKEWFGKSCDNGNQNGCDNYKKLNQR